MSTSNDLRLDAERDLRDLGVHIKVIDGCQELSSEGSRAFGLSKDFKEGVLFSTYSMFPKDPTFARHHLLP
jgi:hypothetical protein